MSLGAAIAQPDDSQLAGCWYITHRLNLLKFFTQSSSMFKEGKDVHIKVFYLFSKR
jgi:hypothetical protein